jgi:formylglycine-generating enzyme required for sulfatase activity
LFRGDKLYQPEWRELMLLLGGILHVKQGTEKVDGLFQAVLDRVGQKAALPEQARCAGLLGAMLADLRPLKYETADPRYRHVLEAALGIFDPKQSEGVDIKVRLEAAEALGQAGDPRLRNANWVTIPAGTFLMGAQKTEDPEAHDQESPVHEVYLDAYRIGRYPVSVEEYRRFVEDDGYQAGQWWKAGGFGGRTQPDDWDEQLLHLNRPVVGVSWYEAAAYCAWAGVRLPTEAEWERVARGEQGRMYPWGNEEPDPGRANYDETNLGQVTPVGLFPRGATPDEIHDLAGNVWEWVADWFAADYYGGSPRENPRGPGSGTMRVVRGGSWNGGCWFLRAACRFWNFPDYRGVPIGFRCVGN